MGFKFVSHKLWSKRQNILRQHMHKREFWILTNRCRNVKHENEAEAPWLLSLVFVFKIIFTFIGQNPKFFFMHVLKKHVLPLLPQPVRNKLEIPSISGGPKLKTVLVVT